MNFIKIGTASALIAMSPAIVSAGGLANVAIEEVVIAPEQDDDGLLMGNLGSGAVLGALAILAIALAASDTSSTTCTTNNC